MFDNDFSSLRSQEFDNEVEKIDPFQKFYRAFVIKNDDPEHRGKIQVRIPTFHGLSRQESLYFNDDQLPWAEPGLCFCASNNSGSLMVPEMGSVVWVSFEYGTNAPIYFGGMYFNEPEESRAIRYPRDMFFGDTREVVSSDRLDEYRGSSDKIIYKSPKGAKIVITERDHQESIQIVDAAGQKIILESNLDSEQISGVLSTSENSKIRIERSENESITLSKDTIELNAKYVKINGKPIESMGTGSPQPEIPENTVLWEE